MGNKDNTSKVGTVTVAQIFFAILVIVLCGCLVYGYSGVYISDSTSDILIKIMATGSVVLFMGSACLAIIVKNKIRWIWAAVTGLLIVILLFLIHELGNLRFQF